MTDTANFRDSTGLGWVIIDLIALAWVTMPASIVLLKCVQW